MSIQNDSNQQEVVISNDDEDLFNKKLFYQNRSTSYAKSCSYIKNKLSDTSKIIKKNLSDASFYKNNLFARIPILKWFVIEYKIRKNLVHDLIAGLTIGIMSIPQCMGISLLANLPPVHGLHIDYKIFFIYLLKFKVCT